MMSSIISRFVNIYNSNVRHKITQQNFD